GVVRERGGLQHAGWPGGAFETLDHRWIVFTAPAQHLFERLCVMLGQPDLPNDPRFAGATERPKHIDVILEMAGRWFAARSFDKAMDELHAHDIPHSPVMSMADIFADPHYRAREMIVDVPSDIGALPQPGVTPKPPLTPGRIPHAGPALGHATRGRLASHGVRVVPRFRVYSRRAEYGTRFRYPNVGRRGAPRRQPRGGHPRAAGGESRWPGPERRERRAGGAEEQPVAVVTRAHGAWL